MTQISFHFVKAGSWVISASNALQVDLLDMLYQKSLRLGIDVRNARGVGTVVNLQSNDANKVWMMPVHIHTLWNSPFQVGLQLQQTAGLHSSAFVSSCLSGPLY